MINFVCSSIKNFIAFYPDDLKVKWQGGIDEQKQYYIAKFP